MHNHLPSKNASGDNQLPGQQELDDLMLRQNDPPHLVHSHGNPLSETAEATQSAETAVPPHPDTTDLPADPAVQNAFSSSQAPSIVPVAAPINAPVAPAAQTNAVPTNPQPVPYIDDGLSSDYVMSQGSIGSQGSVVHQGDVVPESSVQLGMAAPQGLIPTTPQPDGTPARHFQQGSLPQTDAILQPGSIPQSDAVPPGQTLSPYSLLPLEFPPQQPRPRVLRDKSALFVIGNVGLVGLILLGIILGIVSDQGKNATASVTPVGHPTSAFQATSCPFAADILLLQSHQESCGFVTVPENRSVKNGKKIKLALAIFKPQQYINSSDPTPVIRLDGGPGIPTLSYWAQAVRASNFRDFVFDHELIMFDQRGSGYSTPSLTCLGNAQNGGASYGQTVDQCYQSLVTHGIDLNGFNSLQNAADVADIIHALGYQRMTLYGVSYGTRLALTTMRLYPSVVQAAVLDSVYPPNHNRSDLASDAQHVFTVLFDSCIKNSYCSSTYPELQTTFYALVDRLNRKPITLYIVDPSTNQQYHVKFAGDGLISFVFQALYVTDLIRYIPQIISQVKNYQYTNLTSLYSELVFGAAIYGEPGIGDTFSFGFFYSVECSEDWPFLTRQSITQSEQGIEPHLAQVFGQEYEQGEYNTCQIWKVDKVPNEQKQAVVSSIPTLITTGEYDPITSPDAGREAGKTLSHSYFFEFPGQGHGQLYSSPCSNQIISAFENTPTVQPDSQCISHMAEPQFL